METEASVTQASYESSHENYFNRQKHSKVKHLNRQHLLLAAAVIITVASALAAKPSRWETEARGRKAEYIFLEAANAQLRGDDASNYELLRHAYEIDPDDEDAGNSYALYLIHLERDDSTAVNKGLGLMKRYFDNNPSDLYSGLNYALLSQNLGNPDEALRAFRIIHSMHPERTGITYRYADVLAQSGRNDAIDSALSVYDSLEVSEGPSLELTSARMRALFLRQDTASVINEARRLLQTAPMSVENNLFLANVYSSFNSNDSALAYFNRACDIDTTNAFAVYSRAGFFHEIGDSAAFDREIFKVLKMDNLDMPTKMEIMRGYISELYGDSIQTPRILDLFNAMVDMHPHESDLREFYAAYLFTIGRYDNAASQQERALDLEPANEQGWANLITMDIRAEQYSRGLTTANSAIHFFPESGEIRMMKGGILAEIDSIDSALECFKESIALTDPSELETLSNLHCWIGDINYQQNRRDSAFVHYQMALDLNPLNVLALNNCAYYMADEGIDLDKALTYIERVMDQGEADGAWIDTYAWVLFKLKEYAKAREQIDRLLNITPEPESELLHHAGDIYFMDGDHDKALDFWQQALKLSPDDELLQKKVKNKSYYYE